MLRQVYSPKEVEALMAVCNGGPTGKRNAAMILVLYRTGIRVGELLGLDPRDVDLELGRLAIMEAKGGKSRVVPLDDYAQRTLADWLERREQLHPRPDSPLFCTSSGEAILPSYVRTMLKRLARFAGIEKRVHPHGFRHTFATEIANEGLPLNQLRDLLGHESLNTTNTYVAGSVIDLSGRTWGRE